MHSACTKYSCCAHPAREFFLWAGLVSFVIGAVILLQLFDIIPSETWNYLWPSILVIIGLKLMISGGSSCCECETCITPMETSAPKKKTSKKKGKKK